MATPNTNNRGDSSDESSDNDDSDTEFIKSYKQFGLRKTLEKMTTLTPDQRKEDIEAIKTLIELGRIQDDQENEAVQNVPIQDVDAERPIRSRRKGRRPKKPLLLWQVWEQEDQNFVDEHLTKNVDLESLVETADPPSDLVKPLMKYQKEWLAWAIKQEAGSTRGGILADEMGMGKTLQAIALVLAKREFHQNTHVANLPSLASTSSTDLPSIKATLVVCPVVAVTQWVDEIDKFTAKGSSKVLLHHGPNREKSSKHFPNFDFVITTYRIVEAEYGKSMMAPCPICGGSYKPGQFSFHLKNHCVKEAKNTEKKPSEKILHSVNWNRIILDEAQYIKDRSCNTTKAIFALESSYKWALTGTPLQNHVGDLYSLVRFLQVVPYSYYLCKICDCAILEYRPGKCSNCGHDSWTHFCWWKKYISKPILNHGNTYKGKRAMILLKQKVLKHIALRRTKKGRADLRIPHKIETVRLDALDVQEKDFYESLYSDSQAQFNTFVTAGTVMNNYAHIFELLTRLRQAADHPYLVVYSKTAASRIENMDRPQAEQVCVICHDPAENPVITCCAHTFCKACLLDHSVSLGQVSCKTCSRQLTVDLTSNSNVGKQNLKTTIKGFKSSSILNRINLNDFQTSTKIEALSCVSCVQLDGSMSLPARDASIKKFKDDPDCKILLMSLKAGGVALNLTVASYVFLMDPWWNPAAEQQAQDRVHRIGQHKVTRVVKFVIENTIEERVLELRERKKLALDLTVEGSSEAPKKLTIEELRQLFERISRQ